jgi:hypothetical protein
MYRNVSLATPKASNDHPDHLDKIRHDGSRVYNTAFANRGPQIVERNYREYATYGLSPYERSRRNELIFETLLREMSKSTDVKLVLSPYHPTVYAWMQRNHIDINSIEERFRRLANKLRIDVLGSYDPNKAGCNIDEFYDGMHPKQECMRKTLNTNEDSRI